MSVTDLEFASKLYSLLREHNPHLPPPDKVLANEIVLTAGREVLTTLAITVYVETPEDLFERMEQR